MVAHVGGYYGAPFKGSRGVTQGKPLSPTIFNMVADAVICHWDKLVVGEDAGAEGFGGGGIDTGRTLFMWITGSSPPHGRPGSRRPWTSWRASSTGSD